MGNRFGLQSRRLAGGRKRKGNDLPAGRANGQMRERLLLLMLGQRVLDEGVELVRVWMLPGLEKFAHSCLDAAAALAAVCSENESGLRTLQQSTQIDFQIARVVAQGFFSRPLAQSARPVAAAAVVCADQ